MFGGIVETIGIITDKQEEQGCTHFFIEPKDKWHDVAIGQSIAVNGICLTATHVNTHGFSVTAVPETLRLTNLGQLAVHSSVNLERSLRVNDRIGGHIVQGHVDAVGKITQIEHDTGSSALLVTISLPEKLMKYIVAKGYITLDGMSITVITDKASSFTVTIIPHTQAVTIANYYQVGSLINIEVDMMGKYIEKLMGVHANVIG